MKKKYTYFSLLLVPFALAWGVLNLNTADKDYYQPRVKVKNEASAAGAAEYNHQLRANQFTGKIDPDAVNAAKDFIRNNAMRSGKKDFPLQWEEMGPDNVGGRTRGAIIDRNNHNIWYAGGVAGGVWKSTNAGETWYPIVGTMEEGVAVVSMAQTVNGTIYYGTGEGNIPFNNASGVEGTLIQGDGIYRSTDNGETFELCTGTGGYTSVLELAAHPTQNLVFAATETGLRYSDDDGASWTLVKGGDAMDVTFDKNGTLIYYNGIFLQRSTNPTDANSYETVFTFAGNNRMEVAFSYSDPNYCYAVVSTTANLFGGLFQSKDNGKTFEEVFPGPSDFFTPLSSTASAQGGYNICIAVHPTNPEVVYFAGVDMAKWTPAKGGEIFASTFDSPTNPAYVHADKHKIFFDTIPDPDVMVVASDGGIGKSTNAQFTRFKTSNRGYGTIQFYGIAANTEGEVLGGSQDNGTIYVNGLGSTKKAGIELLGGDGFRCEISEYDPNIFFMESYYGQIWRTTNKGVNSSQLFNADSRIPVRSRGGSPTIYDLNSEFNTCFKLWEADDSIARLFVSLPNAIWMANNATSSAEKVNWFRVHASGGSFHSMDVSRDGNHLFAARRGEVVRVDYFNGAHFEVDSIPSALQIADTLRSVDISGNLPGGRFATDIHVDKNNPNRVIVTFGNYNNNNYVYRTNNALDDNPTWTAIDGSTLPNAPVYAALIPENDTNAIILGTEFGIWATTNANVATPMWEEHLEGVEDNFPRVPVYELKQVNVLSFVNGVKTTEPMIYAGTHGRGIWKTESLHSSVERTLLTNNNKVETLKAYPNPAADKVSFEYNLENNQNMVLTIKSLDGKTVYNQMLNGVRGKNTVTVKTTTLATGYYVAAIEGGGIKKTAKIIVAK